MSKDYNNENIIHVKEKNNVEYIKFKILEKYSDRFTHAITLRYGGVSKTPYESLNFRRCENEKDNVDKNVKILCDTLNIDINTLCKAKQEHTTNVLLLDKENKKDYLYFNNCESPYDAYIIKDKDISTYITTADCVPIIMYDTKNDVIAVIHSGWRGTVGRIYLKVINILKEKYNSNMKSLIVCIGPHIRKCCFSSEEEEFKSNFTNIWKNENDYIYYEDNKKRFHIDMEYLITKDLENIGVEKENIVSCKICTSCNSDDFFSCRALKKEYNDFGTFATLVCKK